MKLDFIILAFVMATAALPEAQPNCSRTGGPCSSLVSRAMTRCECAEVPFQEVARLVYVEGLTLAEVRRRTGCGDLCTACLPDLHHFLEATGRRAG